MNTDKKILDLCLSVFICGRVSQVLPQSAFPGSLRHHRPETPAPPRDDAGQVYVDSGNFRPQSNCFPQRCLSSVEVVQLEQCGSKIVVKLTVLGIDIDRLAKF